MQGAPSAKTNYRRREKDKNGRSWGWEGQGRDPSAEGPRCREASSVPSGWGSPHRSSGPARERAGGSRETLQLPLENPEKLPSRQRLAFPPVLKSTLTSSPTPREASRPVHNLPAKETEIALGKKRASSRTAPFFTHAIHESVKNYHQRQAAGSNNSNSSKTNE